MGTVNTVLAANILKYRKKCSLTQDDLAEQLGVTFQAVSKWENARTAPDIAFLPQMADLFGCSIDDLFSRTAPISEEDMCFRLPWEDDNVIRGIVCEGRRILQAEEMNGGHSFTFVYKGDAKNVVSQCNITVEGDVSEGCSAANDISVGGYASGGCYASNNIDIGGDVSGGCYTSNNISVGCDVYGGCYTSGSIAVGCDVNGEVNGGSIGVGGDVKATSITGNVKCKSVECKNIEGDVIIEKGE